KYFNAELGESKSLSGLGARSVDINDLKDDKLEEAKIAYITVDDDGNDMFDCKSFKGRVDKMTAATLTAKRQEKVAMKQEDARNALEARKQQERISFDPTKQAQKQVGGGPFGIGARRVAVPPPQPTGDDLK